MIEELQMIMSDITGRDFSRFNEDVSLFSPKAETKARDILYLFLEVEKRYGVLIDAEKINDPKFFTMRSIAAEIEKKK